ncbi:hypothetical protein KUTeg_009434 [Tegillarca granosa]|uniref:BCAS3 WD40 domain-containing protein n=1 Tax=Tegillarca granosa TaxID=220873 RepID=A0ABQ9F653_TEGGR|nr:hypothetical protein KUTeg_009434 [Tegillarca granosa]
MAAESPKRTMKYSHTIIRPHAFSDKSVMESVVDFISDVVPQAYCGNQKVEDKEKIQWVKFENTDGNDLANNPDFNSTESKGIPLLLILGYSNGVQIWNIMPNGEAQEALSLRQGPIKILRVLPTPTQEYDPYSVKRPLAAICDTSSAGQPYCSVKFVSLRTGDEVHNVSFKTLTVHGIECNKRVMLIPLHQSCGGMSGDGAQSYAATVISAAKGAFKGLTMFGEAIVSNVTGTNYKPAPTTKKVENVVDNAHFHAHANEPVAAINFDVTGTLLLTACKLGHNFHVFRIMAHPCSSSLGAVHHLYTLHRGDTTAKVIDMSFSQDRTVNLRTHCSPRVVNRASRYHKSAGLDETDYTTSARRSPVLSGSPGSSTGQYDNYPSLMRHNAINNSMGNPRLPPFPHPTTVYPLAQIKQPLNLVTTIGGTKTQSPTHSSTGTDNIIAVSSCFCTPRLWVGGSPNLSVDKREERRAVDSLFVVNHIGTLVEYILEPKPKAAASEKISDESMLDLAVTGYTQWHLQRSKTSEEVKPPLANLGELAPVTRHDSKDSLSSEHSNKDTDIDEQWLSQVEIFTHVGPHRRLWMGPQFAFKTYQNVQNTTVLSPNSSALLSQSPEANVAAMDIPTRSSPVAMPNSRPAYRRQAMGSDSTPPPGKGPNTPLLIEAGSFDQSPNLCDVYSSWAESTVAKQPRGSEEEEDRIKETLAEAMLESPLKEGGPSCIRNGSKVNSERELLGKLKNEKGRKKSGKKLSDLSSVKELCPSEVPEGSKRKNESVNRLELEKSKSSSLKQNETGDIPRFKPEQEENMLCPKVESDKASNSTSKKSKKSKKGKDACKTNTEKVTDEGLKVSTEKNVEKGKLQESKDYKDVKTLSEKTEGKDVQVKSESMKESMVGLENAKENKVKLAQDKVKTSKVKSDSECMEEDRLKTVSVETTKNLVKMVDKCTEIVKMIDKGTEMDLKLDVETTDKMIQNKKAENVQVRSDVVDVEEMFGGNSKGKSVHRKKVEQHTAETLHDFEFQKKDKGERVEKTEQEKKELSTGTINNESTDESKAKSQSGKERKNKNKKSDVVSLYVKEQTEDIAISDYNTNESAYSGFPKEISDDKNTDEVASNLKSDVDMIEPKIVKLDRVDDVKNVACGNIDLTQTDVSKKKDENLVSWDSVENTLSKKRSKSKNKKASSPVPQVAIRDKNLDSKKDMECMSEKEKQKPVDSSRIEKKDEGLEHTPKETTGKKTKSNGKKEMSPVSQVTTGKKNVDSKDDIERMSEKEKQKSADSSSSGKTDKDVFIGSNENLSTSSGSSTGISLPRGAEHCDNIFGTSHESPDSS